MESIEQMINRLCPNGVEWKKISEIGTIYRGVAFSKKDFTETGTPCIHYGQIYTKFGNSAYKTYTYVSEQLSKGKKLAQKGDLVMAVTSENMEDVGKCLAWLGEEDILVSNHACYIRHSLNPMYLAYYLQSVHFFNYKKKISKGVKVIDLDLNMFGDMLIPVPPMEIQNRIVEVLDKMTTLTAELEAELEARKQQYEYYRNKLLRFNKLGGGIERVAWKKISEICVNICSGGTPSRGKSEYFMGSIPWLRTQEVNWTDVFDTEIKITEEAVKNSSAKIIPVNCVIVAMYGATAAKSCINKIELTTNQACCNLQIDSDKALYKYVYYWICNKYELLKSLGEGSQSNLNAQKVKDFLIPVPSMEEQERIVSILDRFEALTTDLQTGLPAEIEARRQQYEYYRNKLLTFKQKAA